MLLDIHIDWNTIVTATAGALILSAIMFAVKIIRGLFGRHEKRTTLLEIKQDAMIYGLGGVNHGFGEAFTKNYTERLEQLKSEYEFIEN